MEKASQLKEEGTAEFIKGDHQAAASLYKKAAHLLSRGEISETDNAVDIYIKCWGNAAMCYAKEKSWSDVIECCDEVFCKFPDDARENIKLLYRRGLAYMHTQEYKDAKVDLLAAYGLDNNNKDVRKAIQELKKNVAESKKKVQSQFGGIFGKANFYEDKNFNVRNVPSANGDELINMPDTALAAIAEYMTKTERALTAVAMTASSKSWGESNWKREPFEASKVMVSAKPLDEIKLRSCKWSEHHARKQSYQWDFMDFEDISKSLAAKLRDVDIGAMLVCIDAVHTIKKLKLRGCIAITGSGLEPLRGSVILEQLDLSLIGSSSYSNEKSSTLVFPPVLSESAVIPILDSIIDNSLSVLKHLQLPKKWRDQVSLPLNGFLDRYNQFLNSRQLTCCQKHRYDDPPCGETCTYPGANDDDDDDERKWMPRFGVQQHSCYECNKFFCEEHSEWMTPYTCEVCDKLACSDCHETAVCDECFRATCWKCTSVAFCMSCERHLCGDCNPVMWCDGCEEAHCRECNPHLFCDIEGCMQGNCTECADGVYEQNWTVNECTTCGETAL